MDATTALREALARLRRPAVLALGVGFALLGVATVVAQQTLVAVQQELLRADAAAVPESLVPLLLEQSTPLALPAGPTGALAFFAAAAVLAEFLTVVALRVFADRGGLAASARHRIGRAVVVGLVVGVVAKAAVLAGLALFVVPGAFLATALLFAHARVAIAGDGVVAALRNSWALTRGDRVRVFGVVVALLGFYFLPRAMGGVVPDERLSLLVSGALLGPANLLATGLVARAYVALEAEAAAAPTGGESAGGDDDDADGDGSTDDEEDRWNQPLGPDDLPEP